MKQGDSLGVVGDATVEGRSVLIDCGGPCLSITVLTPAMIRVRLAPDGRFPPRPSWAVNRPDDEFPLAAFSLERADEAVWLRTESVHVRIDRDAGRLTFMTPDGRPFCADSRAPQWGAEGVTGHKRIEEGEHFYGAGEHWGPLDRQGRRLENWADDTSMAIYLTPNADAARMYKAIPLYVALQPGLAYGLFFNNSWHSYFDFGREDPDELIMGAVGGELDYTVCYGPSPAEVSRRIATLLGTMPMPPLWALGYHHSRWEYNSSQDMRQVAGEFRRRGLPCDVIHFDIDYMDGFRIFTWNRENFPDPRELITDLRRDGFRVVAIVDPGIKVDPQYAVYQEGKEKNYFIRRPDGSLYQGYTWADAVVWPDFLRPEVRRWWGSLQAELLDKGVSGIWNDMNEPTAFTEPYSEGAGDMGTIDLDAPQGPDDERTIHAELHNLYGSNMARASYEGARSFRSVDRPFILTRSGFAGLQRWAACWTGDNSSHWKHFALSLPQLMNLGLSGVPLIGADVGGFGGSATPELFARWLEFGILTPFCRGHTAAGTRPQEPWAFGTEVEEISRRYLRLRYRLLPYLYSLVWEGAHDGAPILRPLVYEFPLDERTYTLSDQVMLGPSLMAAPVLTEGQRQREVYFPAGEWYDWWTDACIRGPSVHTVDAPLDHLPLYVRGGSVVPLGPAVEHTEGYQLDPLSLEIYPGNGNFILYEDDGFSHLYEQGHFSTTRFELRKTDEDLTLIIEPRQGGYTSPQREIILTIHGLERSAAQQLVDGWHYDEEQARLRRRLPDDGRYHQFEIKWPLPATPS